MHLSWMMLRKQGALNNQMLRLGCGLSSPIKIPGYVPDYNQHDMSTSVPIAMHEACTVST